MSQDRSTEGATAGTVAKIVRLKDDATEVVLTAMNWRANFDPKLKDISNFRDGRRKAGTLPDGTMTCDVVWDPDDPPTTEANMGLRMNAAVTIRAYTDETHFWEAPFKVGQISPAMANIDGDVVMMPVSFGLNGSVTYPTDPT